MPNLLFTIGPPRSGKSTFCTNWANEAPNRAIVCADSIRRTLGFEYREENEMLVQGMKDTMIRALLDREQDVIVDGTHSTIRSIQRMFAIDKKATPIWFPSFAYYGIIGGQSFEDVCNKQRERQNYVDELIKRGRETKGEYIVPVIERIVGNIHDLVIFLSLNGPIKKHDKYVENLEFLRNE